MRDSLDLPEAQAAPRGVEDLRQVTQPGGRAVILSWSHAQIRRSSPPYLAGTPRRTQSSSTAIGIGVIGSPCDSSAIATTPTKRCSRRFSAPFADWPLFAECRTLATRRARRAERYVRDEARSAQAAVEHTADRTALLAEIQYALDQLELDQRQAFLLKYVEELSYDEMSESTGVGISALKMRVQRACSRLRTLLVAVYQ